MVQPGRSGLQIVAEAALPWGVAGAEVMAEQCAHLAQLATTRPDWRVGVVPRVLPAGAVPVFVTNGFTMHDSESVLIGTTAGNALVTDPDVVVEHAALLERIEALALFGPAAAAVFHDVGALYRRQ